MLVVPEIEVLECLIDIAQEEVSLGTQQDSFLTGELGTNHVHITDTGNLVGVLELLEAVAHEECAIFHTCTCAEVLVARHHGKRNFVLTVAVSPDALVPRRARTLDRATEGVTGAREAIAVETTVPSAVGTNHHEVTGTLDTAVVACDVAVIVEVGLIPEVITHGAGVIALEGSGSILHHLVILTLHGIEASSKCIGRSNIKVILGHFIEVLGHILQTQKQVGLDLVVGLLQCATVIFRVKLGLGLGSVRNTGKCLADFRTTVRHTEHLSQDVVVIGTNHIGLTLDSIHASAVIGAEGFTINLACRLKLLNLLKHGIGCGDGAIATTPHARGGVAVTNVEIHVLPSINLLVELIVGAQVITHTVITG